jgi:hypothetical protein
MIDGIVPDEVAQEYRQFTGKFAYTVICMAPPVMTSIVLVVTTVQPDEAQLASQNLNGLETWSSRIAKSTKGPMCEEWDVAVTCSKTHVCAAVRLSHLQAIYPEEPGFAYA